MSRLTFGRLQLYVEPRDAWVGVYVAPNAVYVLLVPFLVLRWARRDRTIRFPAREARRG